jgi:hypothetical protein
MEETMVTSRRRNFIVKGLIALAGGLIGKKALAADAKPEEDGPLTTEGQVLKSSVYQGRPPMEPLDTMIRFERSDNNNDRAMTHEVLSLMHEEKGTKSYPWTIYAHLTTHHIEGDACVLCSRLHKENAGWSCGLHSEVFNSARAVGLGVNVEMSNTYTGSEETLLYGVNIMACGPQPCDAGLVVKNNGQGPGSVFKKQISLESSGQVGIDLPARFDVGIHMHGNEIALDGEGKIRVRYKEGRIEFLNGDKVIGHIDAAGEDHKL